MAKQYWLVKQEPLSYPWTSFVAEKTTAWTGVRNFQARNHLRAMQPGDEVAYYHSGDEKRVVGVARVARAAYPDPTADDGDWSCVDLVAERPVGTPVSLATIKTDAILKDMALVRNSRLSVVPVTASQWLRLMKLGGA